MSKTPITCYGGKGNMLKEIAAIEPAHLIYVEPYCGGAAWYWHKQPSQIEVINDRNDFLINFYRVLKTRFDELKLEVECSLSSRSIHRKATWIWKNPAAYDEVKLAWACWYLFNCSFSAKLGGGWKYDSVVNKDCNVLINKKEAFTYDLVRRIELTQIESNDAIKVILSRDSPNTWFYIDPPYIDSDQGHYKGFTHQNFITLLDVCAGLKGKFTLSCFPSDILTDFAGRFGWIVKTFDKCNYATRNHNASSTTKSRKTECLVMNYTLTDKQYRAF